MGRMSPRAIFRSAPARKVVTFYGHSSYCLSMGGISGEKRNPLALGQSGLSGDQWESC